jgi:hypothetical protein
LEASPSLLCEVAGVVVPCCEFQVHATDFHVLAFVLDAQVWETDLPVDHRKVQVAGERFLEPLCFSVASGLGAAEPLIELFLEFVIQSDPENLSALVFNLVGGLLV